MITGGGGESEASEERSSESEQSVQEMEEVDRGTGIPTQIKLKACTGTNGCWRFFKLLASPITKTKRARMGSKARRVSAGAYTHVCLLCCEEIKNQGLLDIRLVLRTSYVGLDLALILSSRCKQRATLKTTYSRNTRIINKSSIFWRRQKKRFLQEFPAVNPQPLVLLVDKILGKEWQTRLIA